MNHVLPPPSQVTKREGRFVDMQRSIQVLDHGGPPLLGVNPPSGPKRRLIPPAGSALSTGKGVPGLPGQPYAVGPGDDQGYVPVCPATGSLLRGNRSPRSPAGYVPRTCRTLRVVANPGTSYAALSPVFARSDIDANALLVDVRVCSGTVAVGVLDLGEDGFIGSAAIAAQRHTQSHLILMRSSHLPQAWRVVVSKHDSLHSSPAVAFLRDVKLLRRDELAAP
jgi:hypothetical protein